MITEEQKHVLNIASRNQQLVDMQNRHHKTCLVCGKPHSGGLHARFQMRKDGSVEASLSCGTTNAGYKKLVHGGIIASLLDGAMINCLFSYGIAAVTGEMTTRILHPVPVQASIIVRGWLEKNREPLYILKAELCHNGRISAKASGKFVNKTYMRKI